MPFGFTINEKKSKLLPLSIGKEFVLALATVPPGV